MLPKSRKVADLLLPRGATRVSEMYARLALGLVGGALAGLFFTSEAHAQCTMDTDCKGDRICENGACVSPPVVAGGAAPSNVVGTRPPATATPYVAPRSTKVVDTRPPMQRHSTGMMAGGIVMVSFVPVSLLVVMVASIQQSVCEHDTYSSTSGTLMDRTDCGRYDPTIYGGLFTGAALLGIGIPLIVIGGKKEPVGTARVAPWASPHGAGLGLRVDL